LFVVSDSVTQIPCSTASSRESPRSKTFNAASFEALANGQVETIKGISPFAGGGSAPRLPVTAVAAPNAPTAVPCKNLRLVMAGV
jgi:hypothetical protein